MLAPAKRRDQHGFAGQAGELYRRHTAAAGWLPEGILRMHDLTGRRDVVHARKRNPLDVAYDGDFGRARLHGGQCHTLATTRYVPMRVVRFQAWSDPSSD